MKRWLLGSIGGVIITGVLTSALWEAVIKPYSNWFLGFLVSVATLGLRSFQNGIYLDIAKGFHEDISLRLMAFAYSFVLAFFILTPILAFFTKKYKSREELENGKLYSYANSIVDNIALVALFFAFSFVVFALDVSRTIYVNQSITYYSQIKDIAAPYLSQEDLKRIDSNFAQIRNVNDYSEVTSGLESIIFANGKILPQRPSILRTVSYPSF